MTDDVKNMTEEEFDRMVATQQSEAFILAGRVIYDAMDQMKSDGQLVALLVAMEAISEDVMNEMHLSGDVDLEFIEEMRDIIFKILSKMAEENIQHEKPSHLRVVH